MKGSYREFECEAQKFYEWERRKAVELNATATRKIENLAEPGYLISKPHTPGNSIPITEVADRWDMGFDEISHYVDSGALPVVSGWYKCAYSPNGSMRAALFVTL